MDNKEETLDPEDWESISKIGHKMLDYMINFHENVETYPYSFISEKSKKSIIEPVPHKPQGLEKVWNDFQKHIMPSTGATTSPRCWPFVAGTGSTQGMLVDMLESGMNTAANFQTRSSQHVTIQVLDWMKEIMDYPKTSSGIFVSGGSMANFTGLAVARNSKAGMDVKEEGLQGKQSKMTAYVSSEGHHCLYKAIEILGIGRKYVHWIPTNENYQMDVEALKVRIAEDRNAGYNPFCVIGNAGTVNTGAFDDFKALSKLCKAEDMWFHIDGAFGAWAKLSKTHRGLVDGLEAADSLAFDLHKWMYMPYVIGCTLVRDAAQHNLTFSYEADYLEASGRMGESDYNGSSLGMQLSDNFRALNPWFLLKMDGVDKYARLIQQNIDQAYYLAKLIEDEPVLELMTPCTLNVVCFRFFKDGLGEDELTELNKAIWWRVYQKGYFFSDTVLDGKFSLRVCITNHRTKRRHLDDFVMELVKAGKEQNNR